MSTFGETDRQAVDSLGGYAHQLLASAFAWTRLTETAELHLEVAEDYAIALRGRLDATQVKRTAGTVSLAAEPIRNAVRSFVRLVGLNPGVRVQLTFLTTAEITTEQQVAFRTGGVPGLRCWREVAEGADADRLREVLMTLDLGEEVHGFIRDRDDKALRSDLLQRIDWRCGDADTEELEEVLRERVAELCLRELEVPPLEGEQRADNVVQHVLRTCIRRTERVLTHGGLRVVLRRATDSGVDRRTLNALLAAAGLPAEGAVGVRRVSGWSEESLLPIPPLVVDRPVIRALLAAALTADRVVLLHGGTGMGKTAVARLTARTIGGNWNFIECRGASLQDAADRLQSYATRLDASASGVILDDLPDLRLLDKAPGLVAAVRGILDRGEAVVMTSAAAPTTRVAAAIGLGNASVVSIPLLASEELLELVTLAGGGAEWVRPVQVASRGGHPQLANAVVTGLRSRGWQPRERETGLATELPEVGAESEAARRRLADTLPNQGARDLLYRTSVIAERFPREVALCIGAAEPSVPLPGEAFDALIGPWVDQVAPDRFRVSPLLQGAGYAVLPPAMISGLHMSIAEALLARAGLEADQADNIFFHGLEAQADRPLQAVAIAVIQSDDTELWLLRPYMPRLASAITSRPIADWSPALAVQLRLAQALVLSARGISERAAKVVRALILEIRDLQTPDRARLETVALGRLLFRDGLSRHMPEWPEMLGRLIEVAQASGFGSLSPDGEPGFGDLPSLLFAFSLAGLRSVASLADAFGRISIIPSEVRATMLAVDCWTTPPPVVALMPWLKERKGECADAPSAAITYGKLGRLAASWGEREWAVAFEAAAADVRAEFNDTSGALGGLEAALKLLGDDRWLRRAEQKVRYQLGHDDAVIGIVDVLGATFGDFPIEASHLLREGAVSASRLGRHDLAARWFRDAAISASHSSLPTMQAMAVGLMVDAAAETWRSGDRGAALANMAAALDNLDKVDSETNVQSGFVHRIVRHSLLWFAYEAGMRGVEVDGQAPVLPPGACSHPEPNQAIVALPLTPLDMAHSLLFQVASRAGLSAFVPDPVISRAGLPILSMEIANRRVRLDNAIAAAAPDAFARLLRPAVDASIAARDAMRFGMDNPLRRAEVPVGDMADPYASAYAFSAILAFRVVAGALGRPDAAVHVQQLLEVSADTIPDEALQKAFPPGPVPRLGTRQLGYCAGLVGRTDLGTGELLECCLRLLRHFHRSDFQLVIEEPLARWAKREWLRFADERRFALSNVRFSGPAIKAAAAAAEENFGGLAALTRAAAIGADMPLPSDVDPWLLEVSTVESER